jgi:hypothetical protein
MTAPLAGQNESRNEDEMDRPEGSRWGVTLAHILRKGNRVSPVFWDE